MLKAKIHRPEVDRDVAQKDAKRTFGCGHSLKKAVKNEASGNFDHALLTISECATYPPKYFAKIHYALHVHVIFESFEFGLILELPKVYWWRGESPLVMKHAYRPEEVRGLFEGAAMLTSIECKSPKDCPAEFEFTGSNPDTFISICLGGYCVKWL
ncbi:hypothetical protein P8452_55170 [Trifolium repens]|nr:hypothetical protein P8452_55170 [Trifolium repens]